MSHARHNAHSTYVIGRFASSRVARFRLRAGVFVRAHGSARMGAAADRLEADGGSDIPFDSIRLSVLVVASRARPGAPAPWGRARPAPGQRAPRPRP